MSRVAYPTQDGLISGVTIINSANTPEYINLPGVMINPEVSDEVLSASPIHRKIVNGKIVLKTSEEIEAMDTRTPAEKRQNEYISKCDTYIPVLLSYQLENDARFDSVKAEWEALRNEIKNKYPDA